MVEEQATATATQEASQVATAAPEEKKEEKHDVEYADDEAKNAVS